MTLQEKVLKVAPDFNDYMLDVEDFNNDEDLYWQVVEFIETSDNWKELGFKQRNESVPFTIKQINALKKEINY